MLCTDLSETTIRLLSSATVHWIVLRWQDAQGTLPEHLIFLLRQASQLNPQLHQSPSQTTVLAYEHTRCSLLSSETSLW